jgi:type II secretory pathway pseudopilin PulG
VLARALGAGGAERGSVLIEVMVGAIVLAIATAAVLSGLDGAQDTGRKNKNRSVASTLAQQDIERMRAKPITSLANYGEVRSVNVSGVNYTVNSQTDWVRDSSGVVSCTDDSTQAEYLKVTSTVNSPASIASPVKEATLLTPAPGAFGTNAGTAAVKITDRDGNPLAGVTVAMSGPQALSDTTNDLGCAIFGYITAGAYTAQVSGGLVSWNSEVPAEAPVTVAAGKTSLATMELDNPGSLRAHFRLPPGAPTGLTPQWNQITVAHSKLPGGLKLFPDAPGPMSPSIDAMNLFPHRDGYGVYAGGCEANSPAYWNANYFQPGGHGYVQLEPGETLKDVDVYMPTILVHVERTGLSTFQNANVTLKEIDTAPGIDCQGATGTGVSVSAAKAGVTAVPTWEVAFAVPFGKYRVCAAAGNGTIRKITTTSSSSPSDQTLGSEVNRSLTATTGANAKFVIPTSGGTTGSC